MHVIDAANLRHDGVEYRLIEAGLRRRQLAVLILGELIGQIGNDIAVSFQAAQDEGPGNALEAIDGQRIAVPLNR